MRLKGKVAFIAGAGNNMGRAIPVLFAQEGASVMLVTHNAVIAWFVREVLEAPAWKWVTLNQANCGITVIQHKPGRRPVPW